MLTRHMQNEEFVWPKKKNFLFLEKIKQLWCLRIKGFKWVLNTRIPFGKVLHAVAATECSDLLRNYLAYCDAAERLVFKLKIDH